MIVCTDLDNTMIYSHKHDIGPDRINVEIYQNREISFVTGRTLELLQEVQDSMLVIPTTTRTIQQYERIDFGLGGYEYALVCNGGMLLLDGIPDDEWYLESLRIVRPGQEEIAEAIRLLQTDARRYFELRFINDLFVFTKCREPDKVVEDLKTHLDLAKVDVFNNGEKVYVVPSGLNKGNAILRLKQRIGADYVIAAGDSEFDISMINAADVGLVPHGFIKEYGDCGRAREMSGGRIFSEQLLEECIDIMEAENKP